VFGSGAIMDLEPPSQTGPAGSRLGLAVSITYPNAVELMYDYGSSSRLEVDATTPCESLISSPTLQPGRHGAD
jgi:hypothetical protein